MAKKRTPVAKPLTPKMVLFVAEYLVDLNATQAAIRAGYSKNAGAEIGYRLLQDPRIAEAISKGNAKKVAKLEVSAERVIQELARIGFANMADYLAIGKDGDPYIDLSGLDRDKAAAITEVTIDDYKDGRGEDSREVRRIKFKLADKRAALVDLGRHLELFKERIDLTSSDGSMTPPSLADFYGALAKKGDGA